VSPGEERIRGTLLLLTSAGLVGEAASATARALDALDILAPGEHGPVRLALVRALRELAPARVAADEAVRAMRAAQLGAPPPDASAAGLAYAQLADNARRAADA
jgi:hypothetical protein